MTEAVSVFGKMLFVIAGLAFGQTASPSAPAARPTEASTCKLASLPLGIQIRLKTDYGSWKVQEAENLGEYARKTWLGRKPFRCPGIARGLFQSANTPAYALLLVPRDHPDAGFRFVVFSRNAEQASYEGAVIEKLDENGASNYFIRRVPSTEFFDEESKRKFQLQASDVILMIDSAQNEYGAIIYFWSNGHYRQEPVDE